MKLTVERFILQFTHFEEHYDIFHVPEFRHSQLIGYFRTDFSARKVKVYEANARVERCGIDYWLFESNKLS